MIRLSELGVVANSADASADNTLAVREAVGRARASGVSILHDVPGWVMLSGTVDLGGASLAGLNPRVTGFQVDPSASLEDWRIGEHPNDLMMLGAQGRDHWTVESVGFHGSDAYAQPLTAWGGSDITFRNVYATDVGKCGLQMMGSRNPGDRPIENSRIVGCYVERSKWNIGVDGEARGVTIEGNILRDAVVRHISCDGREAVRPDIETQRVTIRGNVLSGEREAPLAWHHHPTKPRRGPALLASHGWYAIHADNVLTGWPDDREWLVSRMAHLKVLA